MKKTHINRRTLIKHAILTVLVLSLIPILVEGLPRIWLGTTSWNSLMGIEDTVSWSDVIFRDNHDQGGETDIRLVHGTKVTLTGIQHKRNLLVTLLDGYSRYDHCRNYSQVITENGKIGWIATNSLTVAPQKVLRPLDGWFWAGLILLALDASFVVLIDKALNDNKFQNPSTATANS